MSPEVIERKIQYIQKNLYDLKELKKTEKFSNMHYLAMERLFQLIVESASDLNLHFIKTNYGNKKVGSSSESFEVMKETGVIPEELAKKLIKTVGLRNILVHGYERVNRKLLLSFIDDFISDYEAYIKHVSG